MSAGRCSVNTVNSTSWDTFFSLFPPRSRQKSAHIYISYLHIHCFDMKNEKFCSFIIIKTSAADPKPNQLNSHRNCMPSCDKRGNVDPNQHSTTPEAWLFQCWHPCGGTLFSLFRDFSLLLNLSPTLKMFCVLVISYQSHSRCFFNLTLTLFGAKNKNEFCNRPVLFTNKTKQMWLLLPPCWF